jgi:hypothetical protein
MGVLSTASLGDVLFTSSCVEDTISVLTAYFDDSGTHAGSPCVVYAGLIGKRAQWIGLENAWRRKLASPFPNKLRLPRFHMAECMAQKGEHFKYYTKFEAETLASDFTKIIVDAGLYAYGCAVSRQDWDQHVTGDVLRALGDAERYCVAMCMVTSNAYARKNSFEKELAWVFDNRPEREHENIKIFSVFEAIHNRGIVKRPKPTIAFESSEQFPALQAADIVAWGMHQAGKAILLDKFSPDNSHLGLLNEFRKKRRLGAQMVTQEVVLRIVKMVDERGPQRVKDIADLIDGKFVERNI